MKEIRVYIVGINDYKDNLSNEEFVRIAEERGRVYSLPGFVEDWNEFKHICPNPRNSFIRFIEVECAESINFEEWDIPTLKE